MTFAGKTHVCQMLADRERIDDKNDGIRGSGRDVFGPMRTSFPKA
jgi:hypothetical protein